MKPGIYPELDEKAYHADPDSLSASAVKRILRSPAHYRTPFEPSDAMDLGSAVHSEALGAGAPVVYTAAGSWRTKGATEERDAIRADGGIALLERDRERVEGMVASLRRHPLASQLLTAPGQSEVSMFWDDDEWGIQRRCRWDRLTESGVGVDLKTTSRGITDHDLVRAVVDYGYDFSAAWYLRVAAGLAVEVAAFSLVFVQSAEPYAVRVVELSEDFIDRGEALVAVALERLRDCTEADLWPAYTDPSFTTLHPPRWAREIGVPA